MKKSWIALLASFIFPGAGHLYLGLVKKGIILILLYIVSVVLTSVLIGFIPLIIIWIYSMVDSYKLVPKINNDYKNNVIG
nr:DUF6677 family protein [Niallia taxi]